MIKMSNKDFNCDNLESSYNIQHFYYFWTTSMKFLCRYKNKSNETFYYNIVKQIIDLYTALYTHHLIRIAVINNTILSNVSPHETVTYPK